MACKSGARNDHFLEYGILEEENNSLLVAEGYSWRGFADELQELHYLKGASFINQVEGEANIYSAVGEESEDYENLLNAARKAVEHGYCVFILPNPKGIRTADFIFERKGVYKLYDLKTIMGRSSVSNRLLESIGQANRVLLNMAVDYNPIALARNVKSYFEKNPKAVEVLIFKGHKCISVLREDVQSKTFHKLFIAKYIK